MPLQSKKIAVLGLGYVGLPLVLLASRKGYSVVGIDINKEKVALLEKHISPFKDETIQENLKATEAQFTFDIEHARSASIIIMCVPTPVHENHMPDLSPVEGAARSIGKILEKGQLVVLESTVNPGVSEEIVLPILEKESGLKAGSDFYLAHCPERINPGDSKWNVENIPRVFGSLEEKGLRIGVDFYSSIITAPVKAMGSLKEAEAVKIVENSFRDINIAFVNELAMSFSRLGIDVMNVINGAATKPFAFLAHYPGCGVGGHCIPVDPYYLIEYAHENGFEHDFLRLARRINNHMPKFTVEITMEALNDVGLPMKGTRVALLGISYKANIDDCRESPSFEILKHLKEYEAEAVTFDPFVPKESSAKSLDEALRGAEALIVATAHSEFKKNITPAILKAAGVRVFIDGRNAFDKASFEEAGIVYKGIGK